MAEISFKSVGKTREERTVQQLVESPTPIGVKTPLRPGNQEGIFAMHYNLVDQVHDNFRNLILTNWGEHLGLYDYGGNLRPLMTELVASDDFDTQAMERISGATQRWMPFISLESFESTTDHAANSNTAVIRLTIVYSIPSLNVIQKKLEVTLYAI